MSLDQKFKLQLTMTVLDIIMVTISAVVSESKLKQSEP